MAGIFCFKVIFPNTCHSERSEESIDRLPNAYLRIDASFLSMTKRR